VEAAVLGAVLLHRDLGPAGVLTLDDLFDPVHRAILEGLLALAATARPVDPVVLWEELRRRGDGRVVDLEVLNRLTDRGVGVPPGSTLFERHVETLRRLSHERRVLAAAREVIERAGEGADDFVEWAEGRMLAATQSTAGRDAVAGPKSIAREFFQALIRRASGQERLVRTRFPDLNDMLDGGMRPGQLVVLAGRPGMGKTSMAVDLATGASIPRTRDLTAHGTVARRLEDGPLEPTLYFSLEMSVEEIADRVFASEAPVEVSHLRRAQLVDDEKDGLHAAGRRLILGALHVDDSPGSTLAELESRVRRFRARRDLFGGEETGLVVVDHGGLVRPNPGAPGRSREQEVSDVSKGLKRLAKSQRLPVLLLWQLNRGVEARPNKRPLLSDLRDSGSLEEDADLVMFMFREEYYHDDKTPEDERRRAAGQAECIVAKQRNGKTGSVRLTFRQGIARFDPREERRRPP
jgi:replicative DNA helicase